MLTEAGALLRAASDRYLPRQVFPTVTPCTLNNRALAGPAGPFCSQSSRSLPSLADCSWAETDLRMNPLKQLSRLRLAASRFLTVSIRVILTMTVMPSIPNCRAAAGGLSLLLVADALRLQVNFRPSSPSCPLAKIPNTITRRRC